MLLHAGHFHIIGARRDDVDQRRLRIELAAELVEVGDFDLGALTDLARVGLQFAEDQAQQRRLAGAVGTDQANLVAAHQAGREIAHHGLFAKALGHVRQLGHQLAALFTGIQCQLDLSLAITPRRTVTPQLLEAQDAAFVARTPGFHALPDPHLFLCQELVEPGVGNFLVVQHLRLALLILGEAAGAAHQLAAVEFDDACRQTIEEAPVVGDEEQRHVRFDQQGFQPLDGSDVEMVGRLVQEQHIGRHRQRLRQRQALLLATGKAADFRVRIEREAGDDALGLRLELPGAKRFELSLQHMQAGQQRLVIGIALGQLMRDFVIIGEQGRGRPHAGNDGLEYRQFRIKGRLLGHIADTRAGLAPHRPVIERAKAGERRQQGGFAGAVAPDQRDALARVELKIGMVEQRYMAEGERSIGEGQERHVGRQGRLLKRGRNSTPIRPSTGREGWQPLQCAPGLSS